MTADSYDWQDYSFTPIAQDGWYIHSAVIIEDKVEIWSTPIAGWVTQLEHQVGCMDRYGEGIEDDRPAHQIGRRFEPACWSDGEGLRTISDYELSSNVVAVVTGPGDRVPTDEEMTTAVRAKVGTRAAS